MKSRQIAEICIGEALNGFSFTGNVSNLTKNYTAMTSKVSVRGYEKCLCSSGCVKV